MASDCSRTSSKTKCGHFGPELDRCGVSIPSNLDLADSIFILANFCVYWQAFERSVMPCGSFLWQGRTYPRMARASFYWFAFDTMIGTACWLSPVLSFLIPYPTFLFEHESLLLSCLCFLSNPLWLDVSSQVVLVEKSIDKKGEDRGEYPFSASVACVWLFSSGVGACSMVMDSCGASSFVLVRDSGSFSRVCIDFFWYFLRDFANSSWTFYPIVPCQFVVDGRGVLWSRCSTLFACRKNAGQMSRVSRFRRLRAYSCSIDKSARLFRLKARLTSLLLLSGWCRLCCLVCFLSFLLFYFVRMVDGHGSLASVSWVDGVSVTDFGSGVQLFIQFRSYRYT